MVLKPSDFIAHFLHHGNLRMIDERRITQTEQASYPSERDVVKHDTPLNAHLHHVRICLFDIEVLCTT